MSLPNYLAKIKSSGVYRYVFDKSQLPPQAAETLRLVVGYSEKGPFNTPLYIESKKDFISNFGNINKRLERKGIFFHRLALQALNAGPILALNIKPFGEAASAPAVKTVKLNPWTIHEDVANYTGEISIPNLYDTNRFWKLDADLLPEKINGGKLIQMASTDTVDNSCSFFIRPYLPASYDLTLRDWYAMQADMEAPSYLEDYLDVKLNRFFAEVYVFKGEFTPTLCNPGGEDGVQGLDKGTLGNYFHVTLNSPEADAKDPANYDVELNAYYTNAFGKKVDTLAALAEDPNSNFIASYQGCLIPEFKDGNGNYISLDILFNSDNVYHKMLMKIDEGEFEELLAGTDKFYNWVENTSIYNSEWEDDINSPGSDANDKEYQKYPVYYAYHPTYMRGYEYDMISICGSEPADIQSAIFDVLKTEGMQEALTNRVDCEYHYIVDTFESLVEVDCKAVLTAIARKKDNSFAIINFPAIKKFIDHGNGVTYRNPQTGRFDMSLIPSKAAFSLPNDANGASWAAYYTPVIISDGTVKSTIPSAALVSNLYMEKWTSRQPYYIVAGPNYGRLVEGGLVGPDYNYSRADLDVLEPFGVNVIVYVPRKGVYINSNQTAKQVPVTALSKAHVRELVIYLQNEIESMLQNYQWELNTSTLRDTVKTKADTILETIAANGGVYAYINTCDDSNNTPEVIDNEMIILDTSIEPARGAGKMVQRLTIHRTGGISSLK